MSEEEEEQKGKKSPAFFEARLPTIVGAGSRNWRGVLFFSPPPLTTEMHVAREWGDHSNVLELSCKGIGHLRSTGTFGASDDVSMPFPFKALSFQRLFLPPKKKKRT